MHSSTPPTHLPKLPLSLWTNCSITWPLQVVAALPAHEAQECASLVIAPAQVATVFHTSQANSVPVQAASVTTSEMCSQPWHAKLVPTHVVSDTQAVVACQPLQTRLPPLHAVLLIQLVVVCQAQETWQPRFHHGHEPQLW